MESIVRTLSAMTDAYTVARGAVVGAAGGTVATFAMTALMEVGQRAGWLGTMPPRRVIEKAEEAAGVALPEPATDVLASLLHVAVGAGAGAVYGAARAATRSPLPAPVEGAAFGLAFWATTYIGLAPALAILPRPDHDRPGRPPVMIAAHVVFGAVLGAVIDVVMTDRRGHRPST
jgi:hypothetical protein